MAENVKPSCGVPPGGTSTVPGVVPYTGTSNVSQYSTVQKTPDCDTATATPPVVGNDSCPTSSAWSVCRPWDMSAQTKDQCYQDGLVQEGLQIAGAQLNVIKLLGIHEQTKLVDLVGNGQAISSGDAPFYPASNAFTKFTKEWRSAQTGQNVITSAYLGYDFGSIKINNGRERYGIDTSIRHQITTIRIKQSSDPTMRISRARVERSENGTEWYGVAVINLPDDDNLNTISFKHSVPNRYWRLRPLTFAGEQCNAWGVQALELSDFDLTYFNNIQDKILMENRARNYSSCAFPIKGYYELQTLPTELTRFGMDISQSATYVIKVSFNSCVGILGRPIIIGDHIEIPSRAEYTAELKVIPCIVEVTDVTWDSGSYTPGWHPTLLQITAKPALASQETQDIFGDLDAKLDSSGLFDNDDGNHPRYQDYSAIEQTIQETALNDVPERGSEGSNTVREFTSQELQTATDNGFPHLNKIGFNPKGLYVEDAIPSNGAPFTEGPDYPLSPTNGDYHRLTYVGTAKDVPARLYRWSETKSRWVYLETDKRQQFNYQKEILNEYLVSTTREPSEDIRGSE